MRRRLGMKPSGRSTIITSSRKPKIPNEIAVTSKSRPNFSGTVLSIRQEEAVDHRQADGAEDHAGQIAHAAEDDHAEDEDREPELELVQLMVFWNTPRNTPAKPPIDAPIA